MSRRVKAASPQILHAVAVRDNRWPNWPAAPHQATSAMLPFGSNCGLCGSFSACVWRSGQRASSTSCIYPVRAFVRQREYLPSAAVVARGHEIAAEYDALAPTILWMADSDIPIVERKRRERGGKPKDKIIGVALRVTVKAVRATS